MNQFITQLLSTLGFDLNEPDPSPFISALLDALGIDRSSGLTTEQALQAIKERFAQGAVTQAVKMRKVGAREKDWALDMAFDNCAAFIAFAKYRDRLPPVSSLESKTPTVISAEQNEMNRKLGVRREIFLKYS